MSSYRYMYTTNLRPLIFWGLVRWVLLHLHSVGPDTHIHLYLLGLFNAATNILKCVDHQQNRTPSRLSSMFSGTLDKCATCSKTVYPLEKVYRDSWFCRKFLFSSRFLNFKTKYRVTDFFWITIIIGDTGRWMLP